MVNFHIYGKHHPSKLSYERVTDCNLILGQYLNKLAWDGKLHTPDSAKLMGYQAIRYLYATV